MNSGSAADNVRHLVRTQVAAFHRSKGIELKCRLLKRIVDDYSGALMQLESKEEALLEKLQMLLLKELSRRGVGAELSILLSAIWEAFEAIRERITQSAIDQIEAIAQLNQ